MRLLAPSQNKSVKDEQQLRDVLRVQELNKASEQARKNLANAEADFNLTLAKNMEIWAKEEKDHADRIAEMSTEIKDLESKRAEALKPVTQLQKEAQDKLDEGIEYLASLKKREEYCDELSSILEDRLDEVGARELQINQDFQRLEIRRHGIEQQSESTVEGIKRLNKEIAEFTASKEKAEADLLKRKTDVSLIETSQVAKDKILKNKEKQLESWANEIKAASDELDAKRKEALIPVETLILQAETLKKQASEALKQAQVDRSQATVVLDQSKADYAKLLGSLEHREKEISKQELGIIKKQEKVQSEELRIRNESELLAKKQQEYEESQNKLQREYKDFEAVREANARDTQKALQTAELKEKLSLENLQEAQKTERETKALAVLLSTRKQELDDKSKELENESKRLNNFERQLKGTQTQTDKGLEKLRLERESFAVWRTEAEKIVSDKGMENATKSKALLKKELELKDQEKFLAEWSIRLKDERGVLDREYERRNIRIENK